LLRCPNHGRTAVPAVRAFAPIRTGDLPVRGTQTGTPVLRCFVIRIAQFRDKLAAHVAKLLEIDISVIWSAGKYRHIVEARSLLCYWAVRDLGVSMTSLAKRLKLSVAAITQSVERGERLKEEKSYHFP
jgi:hypothetical protein